MVIDAGWDAIVIGAGVGGCVSAAQLAAGGRRVLLVEAGPAGPHPESVLGLDTVAAAEEPSRQWADLTVQSAGSAAPRPYRQGFGVGGGSLINSLLLSPGDSSDYLRWQQEYGCAGWGPNDMAPYLKAAARRFGGASYEVGPVSMAFAAAAESFGHSIGGSSLDQDRLGLLESRLAADDGRRVSAADAYLIDPADDDRRLRSGVTVRSGDRVARILMDGDTSCGVELDGGEREEAPVVVLAAGAIRSPLLLARSGLTSPGVGERLKDHPSFAFTIALNPDFVSHLGHDSGGVASRAHERLVSRLLRWSSRHSEHGDLQAFVLDRVGSAPVSSPTEGGNVESQAYAVVAIGLMRVDSIGQVAVAEVGSSRPLVTTGGLGTESDRVRFRSGVRHVLELLRSVELSEVVDEVYIDEQGTTATEFGSLDDRSLDRFLAAHPGPYAHPAGSCAMGPVDDPRSVVSCEPETAGQVLGKHGLYVADASIMPDLVQGGLQIPIAAVASRVAEGITSQD